MQLVKKFPTFMDPRIQYFGWKPWREETTRKT